MITSIYLLLPNTAKYILYNFYNILSCKPLFRFYPICIYFLKNSKSIIFPVSHTPTQKHTQPFWPARRQPSPCGTSWPTAGWRWYRSPPWHCQQWPRWRTRAQCDDTAGWQRTRGRWWGWRRRGRRAMSTACWHEAKPRIIRCSVQQS